MLSAALAFVLRSNVVLALKSEQFPHGLFAKPCSHRVRSAASRRARDTSKGRGWGERWKHRYPRKKNPTASMSRPGKGTSGAHAGAAPRSPSATARTKEQD